MDSDAFTSLLREEGFATMVEVAREPNGMLDTHSHPFASKALILEGELTLVVDGIETRYRQGEIFALDMGQPHAEYYGPSGVRYLVGRRENLSVLP